MNPFARAAKALLIGLLVIRPATAQQEDTIRIDTALVSVPVIVSDRDGRYVPGLEKKNFSVTVDGKPREIAFFAAESEPLRIAILLDTSRSTENILGKIRKAARKFVGVLGPSDKAMIVTFDYKVRVDSPLTADKGQLEKAIRNVRIGEIPGTVMRDAVDDTVGKHLSGVTGRKAIILLTDGKDFGSYAYESELLASLEESDVMIFPVFYETTLQQPFGARRVPRPGFPGRPRNNDRIRRRAAAANERAREYLADMAALTAGRFYDTDKNGLDGIFLTIADELRRQYRLGFYPDESENGDAVRTIRVRVDRASVSVRARTSYRLKK